MQGGVLLSRYCIDTTRLSMVYWQVTGYLGNTQRMLVAHIQWHGIAQLTDHLGMVLHTDVRLHLTPMCKTTTLPEKDTTITKQFLLTYCIAGNFCGRNICELVENNFFLQKKLSQIARWCRPKDATPPNFTFLLQIKQPQNCESFLPRKFHAIHYISCITNQ